MSIEVDFTNKFMEPSSMEMDKEKKKKGGRVGLARIETTMSREVTFSKRRSGLFKKAFELAVLCDAEVALLVFSPAGRVSEFSSCSGIQKSFKRYQQFIRTQKEVTEGVPQVGNTEIKNDQEQPSRANHDELEQLEVNELEKLEKVLVDALSMTKSKKRAIRETEGLTTRESDPSVGAGS